MTDVGYFIHTSGDSSVPLTWTTPINNAASTWSNAGARIRFFNSTEARGHIFGEYWGIDKPLATASLSSDGSWARLTFNRSFSWSTSGA